LGKRKRDRKGNRKRGHLSKGSKSGGQRPLLRVSRTQRGKADTLREKESRGIESSSQREANAVSKKGGGIQECDATGRVRGGGWGGSPASEDFLEGKPYPSCTNGVE